MRHRIPSTILTVVTLMTLVVTLGAAPAISPDTGAPVAEAAIADLPQGGGSAQAVARLEPVAIGAMRTYGTHLVPPSRTVLDAQLRKEGVPLDASEKELEAARERLRQRFAKQSQTWINPKF